MMRKHFIRKLQGLAIKVDKILREEIINSKMKCDFAEARIYNIKTVGVQGDERTYGHAAEITLKCPKKMENIILKENYIIS